LEVPEKKLSGSVIKSISELTAEPRKVTAEGGRKREFRLVIGTREPQRKMERKWFSKSEKSSPRRESEHNEKGKEKKAK
jgi:hypothetical protein